MHSVLIVIHLFVAIGMVSVILLQRSEGGALGMGGGPGGLMTGRAAGNVLTRATGALAVTFFLTSVALTVFSGRGADSATVVDRVNPDAVVESQEAPEEPLLPELESEPEPAPEPSVPIDE